MCASPIRSENFASLVNARKSSNEQCGTGKPSLCFFAIRMSNVAEFNFVLNFSNVITPAITESGRQSSKQINAHASRTSRASHRHPAFSLVESYRIIWRSTESIPQYPRSLPSRSISRLLLSTQYSPDRNSMS